MSLGVNVLSSLVKISANPTISLSTANNLWKYFEKIYTHVKEIERDVGFKQEGYF